MAYFIFLKSLRSLEEFRKNSHVKIPPKSPSTNFQSLDKFKNPTFNSEIPFSLFSARLPPLFFSSPAAAHLLPPCPAQSARRLLRLSDSAACPFWLSPAPLVRLGRHHPLADRWAHLVSEPGVITFIRQRSSSPAPPPLPGHRAPPSSTPRVPPDYYHHAFIFPPLNPLLNPPPSSMR
jgi:hypothetical protein